MSTFQLIKNVLKPMEEHTEDAKVAEEAARLSVSVDGETQFLKVNPLTKGQNRCVR